MDLQAAETAHQRDPRDQISYKKTNWKCPCNGCKKAEQRERERLADVLLGLHQQNAEDGSAPFGRMAECMTDSCDCQFFIDLILTGPEKSKK